MKTIYRYLLVMAFVCLPEAEGKKASAMIPAPALTVQFAAGLNVGYAQTPPPQNGTSRNAMAFSLMFERRLSRTFYFAPELSYVQRGVQTNLANVVGVIVAGSVRLDYLEVPLLLKAKFYLAPKWKAFATGGPWGGVILNRQVEVLGLVSADLSQRFKQADVGFMVGTGLEYRATPEYSIVCHVRSTFGLVNIDSSDRTFFTRGIQLLFGVQIPL